MNKMQVQFKLYMRSIRLFIMILLIIFSFNIVLTNILGRDYNSGENGVLLMIINFILASLIVIPLANFSMFSYFLSFSVTRRRYLINNMVFNALTSTVLSLIMALIYFSQNFLYGEDLRPLYYMGFSSLDHSMGAIVSFILFYFGLFMLVVSLMGFIYSIFYRMGVMYGLSMILLILSIPLFFLKDIINFVAWGEATLVVIIGLIIISVSLSLWTWAIMSKAEIKG